MELLVLGGGPAGVGAAYRAALAGHRVTLLERADRPGGAAGSFSLAGLRVDHGSHRLHPATDARVLADLRGLLGEQLQRRPRNGRIRLAGRWLRFPLSPADLVRRLPPSFALGAARDAALAPLRRPRADTFAEVLRAGLGPTLCERFYFPYARKIWGVEPDELAGEQARRRVRADSPAKLLSRVLRRDGGERGFYYYPRSGFGAITERLAEVAATAGADLRFGCAVERVVLREDGVSAIAAGRRFDAQQVFSTLPLPALARMAGGPRLDLEFRPLTLVYLVLGARRYTPFDAHYLPEGFTPVTRISEPRNYRDDDDPDDRTVLCAEVPGDEPADPGGLVIETLGRAGLPEAPVLQVVVRRLARAYPIYRVGFEQPFAALDAWASAQPRLLTFGRQGLFAHDNTHHALAMAWDAVDALEWSEAQRMPGQGAGGVDRGAWTEARRRFAAHVVED